MRQIRLILAVVLAVLVAVVALQNTGAVETRLLFATVTMPRAVLIFTAASAGFGLGVLTTLFWMRAADKST
ncbi:MAG: LapA family protein [Acidobacteriota bacterium]|nr:LapA family protein [Acidobacteriota bacterium]